MSLDLSKVLASLGDELVVKAGESVGLERELSLKAASALAANWGKGRDEAVRAAAVEAGVTEEVAGAILAKLVDGAKDQAVEAAQAKAGEAIDAAKEQAMAALEASPVGKAAGGLLGRLFGKK